MNTHYAIVITTTSSQEETEKIVTALFSEHLAACVQVTEIKSYYPWKGKFNIDHEQLLIIKCKQADFDTIQECIVENHSYEIPEIIQVPIAAGLPEYFQWIDAATQIRE